MFHDPFLTSIARDTYVVGDLCGMGLSQDTYVVGNSPNHHGIPRAPSQSSWHSPGTVTIIMAHHERPQRHHHDATTTWRQRRFGGLGVWERVLFVNECFS